MEIPDMRPPTCFVLSNALLALLLSASPMLSQAPQINTGGVVSAGLTQPLIARLAPLSIVSIFGRNFAPAGTAADVQGADLVNGFLPTNLAGVCATFGGIPAPVFIVRPNQLNVQVPALTGTSTQVQVTAGCGTSAAVSSNPVTVGLAPASPEFFYFLPDGSNAIASINALTGAYIGPTGLIPNVNFTQLNQGDIALLFATGLGATQSPVAAGQIPSAADRVSAPVALFIGGQAVQASDLLYVGIAPGNAGLYQINVRIGSYIPPGDDAVVLIVGGVPAPTAYLEIAAPPPSACAAPIIDLFTATPNQLASPGPVTLNYTTENATSLLIGTSSATQSNGTGNYTSNVTVTTAFTLYAQNTCGAVQQSVIAAVGAPGVASVANLAQPALAASAQPGQLIAIQPSNVAQPATVTQVVFTNAAGASVESDALGLDAAGRILVTAPFIADEAAPQGYDTGAVQVSFMFNGMQSAASPLNLTALSYSGDAAVDFGSLVDGYFNAASQTYAGFANDPAFGTSVPAATSILNSLNTVLSQIATGLQSASSVQLPLALIAGPSGGTITLTRADLSTWMAYNENLAGANSTRDATPQWRTATAPQSSSPHLLGVLMGCQSTPVWQSVPPLLPCIPVEAAGNMRAPAFTQLKHFVEAMPTTALQKVAAGVGIDAAISDIAALAAFFVAASDAAEIFCDLSPIHLDTSPGGVPFTLKTAPSPLRPDGSTQQVQIFANLKSKPTSPLTVDKYLGGEFAELIDGHLLIGELGKGIAPNVIADDFNKFFGTFITNMIVALKVTYPVTTSTPQIGNCDIDYFQVAPPSTVNNRLDMASIASDGNPDYHVIGHKQGTQKMWLSLRPGHFLYLDPHPQDFFPYLSVGYLKSMTVAANTYVCAYQYSGCDDTSTSYQPPTVCSAGYADSAAGGGYLVTGTEPYFNAISFGAGNGQISAQQMDDSTWQIVASSNYVVEGACSATQNYIDYGSGGAYLHASLINPPNASNTQAITISATESAGCPPYDVALNPGSGLQYLFSPQQENTPQTASLTIPGAQSADLFITPLPPSACQVTLTLQMTGDDTGTLAAVPATPQDASRPAAPKLAHKQR